MKKSLILLFFLSSVSSASTHYERFPRVQLNNDSSILGPNIIDRTSSTLKSKEGGGFTYVRCYYRISSNSELPQTDYLWAQNVGSSTYYHLQGYWWSSFMLSWKNMFYSDTPLSTINRVCDNTLRKANIHQPAVMISAANNNLSLNYTIWNNDPPEQKGIGKIVAFGDSLSDTNNVFNASQWRFPNPHSWFLGRFSNGPTWVEYLAKLNQLPLYNWAVGGAASNQQKLFIPGLLEQVDSWLIYMKEAKNYRPENTLFTVWIGANDLVTYHQSVDKLIANQAQALRRLVGAGAKKILVLNLPDITRAPEFAHRDDDEKIKNQIIDYNHRLQQMVSNINGLVQTPSIHVFDLATLFDDMLDEPYRYQVTNTKSSCLDISAPSMLNYFDAKPVRAACTN
ncbi:SGNH/GDSL hydrolase family protein, partial [Serratia sp. OS31]|uniref:SGNH/GDSL hydrolase family protein n=1 Tax=Serratia sp. OS31 TaxID=2760844 RepID=UPI0015FFCD84